MPLHAVIQGPLNSPPTPRANWPPNLTADCVPSVLKTAAAIAEQNGIAVVSTWANEDGARRDRIAADAAVAGVIETPDPGRPPDTNGPVPDNRLRQALSTLRGLEELERRGVTGLVAKIRTDQTMPVALVQRFVNDFLSGLDESARNTVVFIPGAHLRSLYEIDDLVFVGTLPAMKALLRGAGAFGALSQRDVFDSRRPGSQASFVDRGTGDWLAGVALFSRAAAGSSRS